MKELIDQIANAFSIATIFDIAIMALIIYKILGFIRESRAEQLVKGLILIVLIATLSEWLDLYTIHWIFGEAMTIGILALVILFQPELRRGLEQVGRANIVASSIKNLADVNGEKTVEEIAKAINRFSADKTGALIVIERTTALDDIANGGTILNARLSSDLLGNIFYSGTPLHDGAVIIRGDTILAAGCVLPLTQNQNLPTELGTRHRAGIGISENSDCVAIMVSEETGIISIAKEGVITREIEEKTLVNILNEVFTYEKQTLANRLNFFKKKSGGKKNVQQ